VLEIGAELLITFAFSLVTGAGLHDLIVPAFLRRRYLFPLLAAGLGLLQLTIINGYLIAFSVPVSRSLVISPVIGACLFLVSAFAARRFARLDRALADVLQRLWQALLLIKTQPVMCAAFVAVLIGVLAPDLHANMATTPYRIGIDQVGYAETAQYLVEGGTTGRLQDTLLQSLQTTDLRKAKAQNLKALDFNLYVDSEFLLKALRWGFMGTIASLTILTGAGHSYRVEFTVLILSYALVLALCYFLLRETFKISRAGSIALAAAIGLNCNLIDVYYEGQLAQVFAAPYLMLLFIVLLEIRKLPSRVGWAFVRTPQAIQSAALFAAVLACVFFAYNEAMVLIGGYFYLTLVLDVFLYRRASLTAAIFLVAAGTAGAVLAFPLSVRWITYTIANIANVSHAGFWQPHWASLAEMVGLLDMYRQTGYVLFPRSPINEIANVTISLAVVAVLLRFFATSRRVDRSFWAVPFLMIAAAYVKFRFIDGILNYSYMKLYTMLLPVVLCVTFAAIWSWGKTLPVVWGRITRYGVAAVVAITGILYVGQYLAQGAYVDRAMLGLYRNVPSRRLADMVSETSFWQPRIKDYMLTPLLGMYWVNENDYPKVIAPYLDRKAAVIFPKDELVCMACVEQKYPKRVIYADEGYLVFDTGLTLGGICTPKARQYTMSGIGYDTTEIYWPGLPIPQCDYWLGRKFLVRLNT
jgi:hypothetical protein